MIIAVVHMTVESERAARENRGKYSIFRKLVRENAGENTCYGRHEWPHRHAG